MFTVGIADGRMQCAGFRGTNDTLTGVGLVAEREACKAALAPPWGTFCILCTAVLRVCGFSGCVLIVLLSAAAEAQQLERWVYVDADLRQPAEVERVRGLIRECGGLRFSHLVLDDRGLSDPAEMFPQLERHARQVQDEAVAAGLQLVPAVFPVGYSEDLLRKDPDQAAALPVREALFVVQGDQAQLHPEIPAALPAMTSPDGWRTPDGPVQIQDDCVALSAGQGGPIRMTASVAVLPWRHYRVSVAMRTQELDGRPAIVVMQPDTGRRLSYTQLRVASSSDWSEYSITFNSLSGEPVDVYVGAWSLTAGTLYLRDAAIEECGLLNLLRRAETPLRIVHEATQQELTEGEDFEPVVDALRDRERGAADEGGLFEIWHESPAIQLRRRLPAGTRLRVSWYHPHVIRRSQVCGSPESEGYRRLLEEQAQLAEKLYPGTDRMMLQSELRMFGWDTAAEEVRTAGVRLAEHLRWSAKLLDVQRPGRRLLLWSDMVDPHQNAVDSYYLVNGDFSGSWSGLSPRVLIVNRNMAALGESLTFFSSRGHRQIVAGYFDSTPQQMQRVLTTVTESGVSGIQGVMYVTRRGDYSALSGFAALLDRHEAERDR